MSEELKPCPFCGGKGYLCQIQSASGGDRYIWVAKCSVEDGCGVEFLGTSRKVDAIREWNRRISEQEDQWVDVSKEMPTEAGLYLWRYDHEITAGYDYSIRWYDPNDSEGREHLGKELDAWRRGSLPSGRENDK